MAKNIKKAVAIFSVKRGGGHSDQMKDPALDFPEEGVANRQGGAPTYYFGQFPPRTA